METELKRKLNEFLSSKQFQTYADISRILLVILLVVLISILISEIETIKLLNSDVCKICMEKTGCNCFCSPNLK